mgnify:CR=1 FL=1
MNERAGNTFSNVAPPPPAFPVHDWEAVFESEESGFIPLVKQAKTVDGLRECTHLIIRSLFTRDNDADIRAVYEQALDNMLPRTGVDIPALDKGVSGIIQLLREIKMYRQTKAAEHQEQLNESSLDEPDPVERREDGEPDPLPGLEISESFETDNGEEKIVEEIFADLLCQRVIRPLQILNQEINKPNPPFILSKHFANHFNTLLREHFAPSFLADSRALVARTLLQPADKRREYLVEQFNGRVSAENLWDRWKDTWELLLHEQEMPRRPEPEKKSGLLGGLKKKKKVPAFMRPMTLEEWEARVKKVKAGNKKAKELWALISAPSEHYSPPEFNDEKLLMGLFRRSSTGLQNHINALSQIAGQGEDIGKGLSNYAQGKDIDLALLAACYQYPDLFLGKKKGLKDMLMGLDDDEIANTYPLIKRFLL